MGLLDNLTNQVLGGGNSQDLLISGVMKVLGGQEGGLAGIVKQFQGAGLGDAINSWVGTGANLPVTPDQIHQGLGAQAVSQIAQHAGISTSDVTSQLSKILPQVIDKLTPNGQLPQGDLMSQGMSLLKGLMK